MSRCISSLYAWQHQTRQWLAGRLHRLRRPGASRPAAVRDPDHVLLIMVGLVGDTVMSTPLLVETRRLWPRARIVVLGQRHTREMLSACPLIDACIEAPADPFSLRGRRRVAALRRRLKGGQFDLAIIALGDQFAKLLSEAGIPVRVGVGGHPLSPFLTHTYEIGGPHASGPWERLNALRSLGFAVRQCRPRLWVSDAARQAARRKLGDLGLPHDARYAAVHPFGSTPSKWWPLERVESLARSLKLEHGLTAVLVGGPEMQGRLPKSARPSAIDATGAFDLQQLLGALRGASLVISTDSGPFHLAGALGRPLVGLFRARWPAHAHRYPHAQVLFGNDPGCESRCSWDGCRIVPCRQMAALAVADVMRAAGRSCRSRPAAAEPAAEYVD